MTLPADGVTSATRAPGRHSLTFSGSRGALRSLPAGQYTLTAMVDSQGYLRERCEGNNITTAVLKITGTSVSVVTRGKASAACSR